MGEVVLPPTTKVDRWGNIPLGEKQKLLGVAISEQSDNIDALLNATNVTEIKESGDDAGSRQASSTVRLVHEETGNPLVIKRSSDVASLIHRAALTVHKAQGSEWRRVYVVMHRSHAPLLKRELLYTAVTRARQDLVFMYSGQLPTSPGKSVFQQGIQRQEITGVTLEQKLDYFRNKAKALEIKAEIKAKKESEEYDY
jgi:superfamily I DNA/RNA helicase